MAKSYGIDPDRISLERFRELTEAKDMLPGRIMLREQMDVRFAALKEAGVQHLGELLAKLSTRTKIQGFSERTGLPEEYLVLLKREAGSYLARPVPLSDYPGIPFEYTELLKSHGLRNSKVLFEEVQTEEQQADLAKATGIPVYRLKELHSLCDLSRITGVGGLFARVLYEARIRSVADYSQTGAAEILERCRQVIEKYGYAAGKLGKKDIQYGINYARLVSEWDQTSNRI